MKYLKLVNYVCFFILISCKKEIKPETGAGNLRYNPIGESNYITNVIQIDKNSILLRVNDHSIAKTEGDNLHQVWKARFDNQIIEMIITSNGQTIVFEPNYGAVKQLNFTRFDADGNKIFNGQNILSEFSTLHKDLIGACSDGQNGFYCILYVNDGTQSLGNKRYLVHVNANNEIDQKLEISGFWVYITGDNQGNIYLTRTTSSLGYKMQLETSKINVDWLKSNNALIKDKTYRFSSEEPDWKWPLYFPFKFICTNNQLHIIKQHNTGKNDMVSGIDIVRLNASDLSLIHSFTIPLDIEINGYLDKPSFYPLYSDNAYYLSLNYGNKAKFVKMNYSDSIIEKVYLSGNQNMCRVSGMAAIGNKVMLFGSSTLLKSPAEIPFVYLFNNQ